MITSGAIYIGSIVSRPPINAACRTRIVSAVLCLAVRLWGRRESRETAELRAGITVPSMRATCPHLASGVQVISNDQAGALLAREIEADIHIMTTGAPAVFAGFGTPDQKANLRANPDLLLAEEENEFARWTLPKVMAAFGIARSTGNPP
jgi:hypothetical protein